MPITKRKGNFPHVSWLDLKGNGVLTECAIFKEDGLGNIYYIELPKLDGIDKNRLARIVRGRHAANYELWDLMSQVTLNNGLNALEYFHQLVKVITPDGIVMNPRAGIQGTGTVNTGNKEEMASMELNALVERAGGDTELSAAQKRAATIAAKKAIADTQ